MEKHFFTFGQAHAHRVVHNGVGVTLDCDSVVQINAPDYGAARERLIDLIGSNKFAFQYTEDSMNFEYFPRGVVLELTVDKPGEKE